MSLYEQALEEWKKRDPYLLDMEGFERFLAEREKQAEVGRDAWREREKYCVERLNEVVIKAVLRREFGDVEQSPIEDWHDFFLMSHRYEEIRNGLSDWLPFDHFGVQKIRETLNVEVSLSFAYDTWRRIIKHPEWYADWEATYGAKGFDGDGYRLKLWLALCVKLGLEDEALEILNNLPEELRHPSVIPEHIKGWIESQSWKQTYGCGGCKRATCEGCIPYHSELRKYEGEEH